MSHDNGCSPQHRDNCKLLLREHLLSARKFPFMNGRGATTTTTTTTTFIIVSSLRESRVVPRISWPRERNMRNRLKSKTRCTGTNLVAHFGLIYRARDDATGKQILYYAAKAETLFSEIRTPRRNLIYLIPWKFNSDDNKINYTKIRARSFSFEIHASRLTGI